MGNTGVSLKIVISRCIGRGLSFFAMPYLLRLKRPRIPRPPIMGIKQKRKAPCLSNKDENPRNSRGDRLDKRGKVCLIRYVFGLMVYEENLPT